MRLCHARSGASTPWLPAAAGASLGAALVVEYPSVLIAAILFLYAASFIRPLRRLGWLVLGGAAPALALAAYHWIVFGGQTTLPYAFSTQADRTQGLHGNRRRRPSCALEHPVLRGLFFSQPWLLLAAPGLVVMALRPALRAEAAVCSAVFVLFVGMNASLVDWPSGWGFGPRYLIPAIPFLVAPAAAASLVRIRGTTLALSFRLGVLGLVGWSAFLMLVATSVTIDVPNSIERPFGDYLLPQFFRRGVVGERAGDRGRQAWNLGQRVFGLDKLASLAPLGGFFLVGGLWIGRTVRHHVQ